MANEARADLDGGPLWMSGQSLRASKLKVGEPSVEEKATITAVLIS